MNESAAIQKRPRSVTVIGVLFLIAGSVGLAYHATEFKTGQPLQTDLFWILFVRLLAVIGAIFLLRGANWARWLLVLWMAYHVALSVFHPLSQLLMHALLLVVIAYFLFRPSVSLYFRNQRRPTSQQIQ
jgi:hypothetical protein